MPVRRAVALLAVAPLLVLAGCSSATAGSHPATASSSPTATAATPSGAPGKAGSRGIAAVTVKGTAGKAPAVSFTAPFTAPSTQSKVLTAGSGAVVKSGERIVANYVGVDGRTGKTFDSSWSRGEPAVFPLVAGRLITGFLRGLVGKHVGDRVLIAVSAKDGYPSGNSQAGIDAGDSLVFVVDIEKAYSVLAKATGATVAAVPGEPTVTLDAKGQPTKLAVPKSTPPAKLVVHTLVQGTGPVVGKDSAVTLDDIAVNWRTGVLFDNTWSSAGGGPVDLLMNQVAVKGLATGLVGQHVGSRVLLVIPPADGFKAAGGIQGTDVKPTDTTVFVVDILGAA